MRLQLALATIAIAIATSQAWMVGQGSKRRDWLSEEALESLRGLYGPGGAYYRRSYWPCAQEGGKCSDKHKCCSHSETCLTQNGENRCVDLRGEMLSGGAKAFGESCTSSGECADLCCRSFYVHRKGRIMRCGPQDEDKIIYHKCV